MSEYLHPVRGHLEVTLGVANVFLEMCSVQTYPVAIQSPAISHRQRPHVQHLIHLIHTFQKCGRTGAREFRVRGSADPP